MNIFVLDTDINSCAAAHCDKHVVKMIVEYCQLLSTTCHVHGISTEEMYKKTHVNHPCAAWVRESSANYNYLLELTIALLDQYTLRYGKVHASSRLIPLFIDKISEVPIGKGSLTPFAIVVNNENRLMADAVSEYRHLYKTTKRDMCTWKTEAPSWF